MKLDLSIPMLTVFLQGLLSFFSPCVLPLIPVYMGYLSGGTKEYDEQGNIIYNKRKVMINTFFFVIGVSFAFFLLGFVMTGVGRFFSGNQILFARIGGIIVIMFGLYQLGVLGSNSMLSREYRLSVRFEKISSSPLMALIMGFVLSFAWTPCVGPVLSTVLIMASTVGTAGAGFMLIAVYTLGYVIPFMAVGLFTTQLLYFFKQYRSVLKYTVKIGGVLMLLMGAMMFTGSMNRITGYMSSVVVESNESIDDSKNPDDSSDYDDSTVSTDISESEKDNVQDYVDAPDFILLDQYGNSHSLSDYNDKIIFLNFWATWCPPCRMEMPGLQNLYEKYGDKIDFVMINAGETKETIQDFLVENEIYSFPIGYDVEDSYAMKFGIMGIPTTYLVGTDKIIKNYIIGARSEEQFEEYIKNLINN